MGKKGGSRHLKSMASPVHWPIHKKELRWVPKPSPGPHPIGDSLPLLLVVRDILGLAKTRREAQMILSEGKVMVNGRVIQDDAFPLGTMDIVEIPAMVKTYRLLPSRKGGFVLHDVDGEEKGFKLCKIINKTTLNGGHLQLNLSDGRNVRVNVKDPRNPKEDIYETEDVLKVKVPDTEILDHIKFGGGVLALVTSGKNTGRWGKVVKVERGEGPLPTTVTIEDAEDERFQTIIDYTFAIGRDKPLISLLEET